MQTYRLLSTIDLPFSVLPEEQVVLLRSWSKTALYNFTICVGIANEQIVSGDIAHRHLYLTINHFYFFQLHYFWLWRVRNWPSTRINKAPGGQGLTSFWSMGAPTKCAEQ